jgi:hypothetical protein
VPNREKALLGWLLSSGILSREHWALHHNYNAFRGKYGPLYTEVTGYGVSLLLNCFRWSQNPLFLEYAQKLAGFIHSSKVALNETESAFRYGYEPQTRLWSGRAYSFDTAICISSLLDLSKKAESSELTTDALEAGNWLTKSMQNKDGSFKACIETPSRSYPEIPGWFGGKGCLHAKVAISLYKLHELSRNHLFMDSFHSSLKWVLSKQEPSGGILAREGLSYIFTHSHCYASEALAFGYGKTGEKRYLSAFRKSVGWLLRNQNKDGSYYQSYGIRVPVLWKRLDATAQACRLFLLMHMIEHDKSYIIAAEKAAEFLMGNQSMNSDNASVHGGLCSKLLLFFRWPELNSWTNLFAVHALHLLARLDEYDLARAIRELF